MSDENEFESNEAVDGGKLRKMYEEALKKNKELSENLSKFEARERARDVESFLRDKGLNPKAAKFVPADADLESWVSENADLFPNATQGGGEGSGEAEGQSLSESNAAAFDQIQKVNASGANQTVDLAALQSQIKNSKDPAALEALMAQYRMQ